VLTVSVSLRLYKETLLVVGAGKDFKKSLMLRKDEEREILREALETMNSKNSRNMLIYHLLTVSPLKNIQYAMSKLAKGFAKK
jgi:hypothetical protein